MPDPRHVFISYSRKDSAIMQRVKQSFDAARIPYWTDEGIEPGTPLWQDEIEQAIEAAGCIVVLLSPDAKKSIWVKRELNYALAQDVPIYPVMVRGDTATSVPFALIGSQYVDIQSDYDVGVGRLLPLLARIFEINSSANARPSKPLWEHIPTIEQAPIDYSQIKPVMRNRDWTPIIRVINGIEMCLVPPGCFMMGSEDIESARPVHEQCFDKPFWIGRYPVTNAQYIEAVKAGVCKYSEYAKDVNFNQPQQPVVGVDWYAAMQFAEWKKMRLPTESEWEFAARGPEGWIWPWGNVFVPANLVYEENSEGQAAVVGSKPDSMSWVGAADMSGNVWEWTNSVYAPYPLQPRVGWANLERSIPRVLRGGSWLDDYVIARCSYRSGDYPDFRLYDRSLRLIADSFG